MARVLGIDYGERRIGLAVSDPTGTIARPLPSLLRRRGKRPPVERILEIAKSEEVTAFVIGLPLDLEGHEGPAAAAVRAFGERLRGRSSLPVHYWDERLTTVRAGRTLRELGIREAESRARGRADAIAACLLLQSYLDATAAP